MTTHANQDIRLALSIEPMRDAARRARDAHAAARAAARAERYAGPDTRVAAISAARVARVAAISAARAATQAADEAADLPHTIFASRSAREVALKCARGSYQRNLLVGGEGWSGATLRGKAKTWGGKYSLSRSALLARMERAGLDLTWARVGRGHRLVLVIELPVALGH